MEVATVVPVDVDVEVEVDMGTAGWSAVSADAIKP